MPGWGEPLTNPASVGLDASRLGRLAAWGEQLVADGQAPFAMSLVARRGKVAHVAKAGESKPGKPVQFDALCRMHSMSKPVTSVALMILHDEGKFQLGDPAWKFLGEKWKPENMRVLVPGGTSDDYETVPCERAVTCHHLLTHTAGLSYGLNPTDGRVQSPVAAQEAANPLDGIYERMGVTIHSALGAAPLSTTLAQFVDKLAECPLMYQPGEKWHYSLATDVCGMLVEAISGMSFWEFLRTRLFVPLGMLDTFFVIPPDKADRQADVYRPGWGADGSDTAPSPTAAMTSIVNISGHDGQDFSTPHVYEMGGGGLVSTLADYAQFALMLLNKGELNGVRVLSSNTVEWMASNHLPDNADIPSMSALPRADFGIGFGLGFGVQLGGPSRHNRRGKGTFYWGGAASTLFWVDPSNDLIAVFLTQMMGQNPARPIHPPLITLVYGALADAPAARL